MNTCLGRPLQTAPASTSEAFDFGDRINELFIIAPEADNKRLLPDKHKRNYALGTPPDPRYRRLLRASLNDETQFNVLFFFFTKLPVQEVGEIMRVIRVDPVKGVLDTRNLSMYYNGTVCT